MARRPNSRAPNQSSTPKMNPVVAGRQGVLVCGRCAALTGSEVVIGCSDRMIEGSRAGNAVGPTEILVDRPAPATEVTVCTYKTRLRGFRMAQPTTVGFVRTDRHLGGGLLRAGSVAGSGLAP